MQAFSSGTRILFARESALLKLQKRGRNGASQRAGEGERREKRKRLIFSPLPLPLFLLSPFRSSSYSRVAISTLPNLPLSYMNQRWLFGVGATRKPLGAKA